MKRNPDSIRHIKVSTCRGRFLPGKTRFRSITNLSLKNVCIMECVIKISNKEIFKDYCQNIFNPINDRISFIIEYAIDKTDLYVKSCFTQYSKDPKTLLHNINSVFIPSSFYDGLFNHSIFPLMMKSGNRTGVIADNEIKLVLDMYRYFV